MVEFGWLSLPPPISWVPARIWRACSKSKVSSFSISRQNDLYNDMFPGAYLFKVLHVGTRQQPQIRYLILQNDYKDKKPKIK